MEVQFFGDKDFRRWIISRFRDKSAGSRQPTISNRQIKDTDCHIFSQINGNNKKKNLAITTGKKKERKFERGTIVAHRVKDQGNSRGSRFESGFATSPRPREKEESVSLVRADSG